MDSCNVIITLTSFTINGLAIHKAGTVSDFHALLGQPTRIVPAGTSAPVGHRNNHIHFYDHLGLRLNEHHFTYQIQEVTGIFDIENAIHPTTHPFPARFGVGGLQIETGTQERSLEQSSLSFFSYLKGSWSAEIQSGPVNGHRISVCVSTQGRKLPSGKRSKVREILSVSVCLEHDPWDSSCRPK